MKQVLNVLLKEVREIHVTRGAPPVIATVVGLQDGDALEVQRDGTVEVLRGDAGAVVLTETVIDTIVEGAPEHHQDGALNTGTIDTGTGIHEGMNVGPANAIEAHEALPRPRRTQLHCLLILRSTKLSLRRSFLP